jgi:hypothetical protein
MAARFFRWLSAPPCSWAGHRLDRQYGCCVGVRGRWPDDRQPPRGNEATVSFVLLIVAVAVIWGIGRGFRYMLAGT